MALQVPLSFVYLLGLLLTDKNFLHLVLCALADVVRKLLGMLLVM